MDILDAARWRCTAWREWAAPWLMCARRWLGPPRPGLVIGVLLHEAAWVVVQPAPSVLANAHALPLEVDGDLSRWQESTVSLSPVPMPELRFAHWAEPLPEEELALWQLALQSLRSGRSARANRLVLAWPDEALWSATLSLTGPATGEELQTWLLEELEAVLPCPLNEVAWDCLWPAAQESLGSASRRDRESWWRRWSPGHRLARKSAGWDGPIAVTCWALPRPLAQALVRMAARQGFESLSVEPRSVALDRAARLATQEHPFTASPSGVTAWGAACRQTDDGPNLLRRQRAPAWWRVRALAPGYGPWLVALAVTGSVGWAWGVAQAQDWRRTAQTLEQRWRQLQSQSDQRNQTRQRQQQDRQQAMDRQAEQQARLAHNQQFVHALQGLAATLPGGVQWQQLDLRPRQLELHAQALDAQEMSQWLAQWPQTLPVGGQARLQWQVLSPSSSSPSSLAIASTTELSSRAVSGTGASGRVAAGVAVAAAPLAIQVQWSWASAAGGVE